MLSATTLPDIRRVRSSAAVLATMFAAPLPEVVEEVTRQESVRLVGVVGHWTDTTAGTSILTFMTFTRCFTIT